MMVQPVLAKSFSTLMTCTQNKPQLRAASNRSSDSKSLHNIPDSGVHLPISQSQIYDFHVDVDCFALQVPPLKQTPKPRPRPESGRVLRA